MTQQKHLKRRIRARQARTGEKYTTARARIGAELAVEGPPLWRDLTAFAQGRGWRVLRLHATPRWLDAIPEAQREAVLAAAAPCLESACRAAPPGTPLRAVLEAGPTPTPLPWSEANAIAQFAGALRAHAPLPANGRQVLLECEAGGARWPFVVAATAPGVGTAPPLVLLLHPDELLERGADRLDAARLTLAALKRPS